MATVSAGPKDTAAATLQALIEKREPEHQALIAGAIKLSAVRLPATGRGRLIIRTDGTQKKKKKAATRNAAKCTAP